LAAAACTCRHRRQGPGAQQAGSDGKANEGGAEIDSGDAATTARWRDGATLPPQRYCRRGDAAAAASLPPRRGTAGRGRGGRHDAGTAPAGGTAAG